ncbi:hypothetical protein [Natronorubrum daqingense]|uniref:Uncharacterized protein n=1 Tax=Natronorubrum daqingense TaxID=588898 RepID=A0A1N7G0Q8_9EURY|nr:hypothetical protein [Natronorubrum daqingense]APX98617.1 hypothetical protein BB347_18150 [Natronorubrum daqingense]SIS06200.1 hypothetical protein SAMN05421809_3646 [Natronorubrum daqingense]
MGKWLTYTVAPREGLSLDEFTEQRVREAYEVAGPNLKDELEPLGYREHGVVSERVSTSSGVSETDIRNLFRQIHRDIRVLYLTRVSDTTDSALISVYEPTTSGKLGLVDERSGELTFEGRERYDGRYDERAAEVRPLEDPREGTDSDEDHVTDLKLEYGARPLFHYD